MLVSLMSTGILAFTVLFVIRQSYTYAASLPSYF